MERNGKAELTHPKVLKKTFQERKEYILMLVALLVMGALSYGLYCNMPPDWQYDPKLPENRTVVILALTLLVMSMLACYYVRYRLSFQLINHHNFYERSLLMSTNSQLQLLTSDLPPSYESICTKDVELPPPYSIVIMSPVKAFTIE